MIRVFAMILLVTGPAAAQQEFVVGPDAAAAIAEYLDKTPLSGEQKQKIREAVTARQYRSAEEILVNAIDGGANSPDLLIAAARVFLLDKNPTNAAIAFKKAEKLRPLSPPERFQLAMAYIAIGRGKWARPELNRLAEGDPKNLIYSYWLGRLDYDDHEYEWAVRHFRAVTAGNPQYMRAWDNLGLSLEGTGHLDDAVASYKEAVRLNRKHAPPSPWPPLNLGTLLTKMDKLKESEEYLREALQYDEKLGQAYYRLGVNLHRQDRDGEALPALQRATELDPDDPEPLYALGQIYRNRGDMDSAGKVFAKFRELKKKQRGM
jgi:tetratricopeptide (TPR) repeat protein